MSSEDIHRAFASLAQYIAEFNASLARNPSAVSSAGRLKLAQEELALICQLEETAGELAEAFRRLPRTSSTSESSVVESLADAWGLAVLAADALEEDDVVKLREMTRQHGPLSEAVRAHVAQPPVPGAPVNLADVLDLAGAVERLAWMLHHLAKLLAETRSHHSAPKRP
jgi:hypothetical protein